MPARECRVLVAIVPFAFYGDAKGVAAARGDGPENFHVELGLSAAGPVTHRASLFLNELGEFCQDQYVAMPTGGGTPPSVDKHGNPISWGTGGLPVFAAAKAACAALHIRRSLSAFPFPFWETAIAEHIPPLVKVTPSI